MACGSDHNDFKPPAINCGPDKILDYDCYQDKLAEFCEAVREARDTFITAITWIRGLADEAITQCGDNEQCIQTITSLYFRYYGREVDKYKDAIEAIKDGFKESVEKDCCQHIV